MKPPAGISKAWFVTPTLLHGSLDALLEFPGTNGLRTYLLVVDYMLQSLLLIPDDEDSPTHRIPLDIVHAHCLSAPLHGSVMVSCATANRISASPALSPALAVYLSLA